MRSPKFRRIWLLFWLICLPTVALAQEARGGFLGALEAVFQRLVDVLNAVFFYRLGGENGMPMIVLWLIAGGLFFTFRLGFINIRAFKHAINVVQGKFDDTEDEGDVSLFQALAAALSGTVGIGNIAGVAIATIIGRAFSPEAIAGGVVGVIVLGFQRAVFSNEAGLGPAAIARSAARTDEPVREGIVALLEPFIDTIVICNMTALVIVITGIYADPTVADLNGAQLTATAFEQVIG